MATSIDHGQTKGYFGTTLDTTLGFIVKTMTQKETSEEALIEDGHGEIVGIHKYRFAYEGSMTCTLINSADAEQARTAIAVGAILNLPQNEAMRSMTGLTIVNDWEISTSNTEYATFTVNYKTYPNLSNPEE